MAAKSSSLAFQKIGVAKPFLKIAQDTVDLLESITAVEKAMAVPNVKIWQIDNKGKPIHSDAHGRPSAPMSFQFAEPPKFGSSVSGNGGLQSFRERPPVSLERISVKWENPKGIILYRMIHITFMVHRPEVLFENINPAADNFNSMIIPGSMFAMEYGWRAGQGVKNGMLNGDGFDNQNGTIVPGRTRVRFVVTNYNFKIHADMQISIDIDAYEDGELNTRQAKAVVTPPPGLIQNGQLLPFDKIADPYDEYLWKGFKQKIQDQLRGQLNKLKQTGTNATSDTVSFLDIANVIFAPVIADSWTSIGYNTPRLIMGDFNSRVGIPGPAYPGVSPKSIGDFRFRLKEVEEIYSRVLNLGNELTLYNFMLPFISILNSPETWDRRKAKINPDDGFQDQTLPEVAMRTIIVGDNVNFYIVDVKREHTLFASSDRLRPDKLVGGKVTRQAIRSVCHSRGVPFVSFRNGNSYIKDSNFNVIADEQVKSIFIHRYLDKTRKDITSATGLAAKQNTAVDPMQVLYSSAITGEITMIGNNAFDVFSMIWLDFGVIRWDGPFRVLEREDIVDGGDFTTRIKVIAEGDDPLGTQGRLDPKAPAPA